MKKNLAIKLLLSMCCIGHLSAIDMNNRTKHGNHYKHREKSGHFNLQSECAEITNQIVGLKAQIDDIQNNTKPMKPKMGGSYASAGPAGMKHKADVEQRHQELESNYENLKNQILALSDALYDLDNQGDRRSIDRKERKNKELETRIRRLNRWLKELKMDMERIRKDRVPLNMPITTMPMNDQNGMVDAQMSMTPSMNQSSTDMQAMNTTNTVDTSMSMQNDSNDMPMQDDSSMNDQMNDHVANATDMEMQTGADNAQMMNNNQMAQ